MNVQDKLKVIRIIASGAIMFIGLFLLKFLPMSLFGEDIKFDASMHIIVACFVLYVGYFFIDQQKSWKTPYFIFCAVVLIIISFQRLLANAHNDIGLILGLVISAISILISNWIYFWKRIDF